MGEGVHCRGGVVFPPFSCIYMPLPLTPHPQPLQSPLHAPCSFSEVQWHWNGENVLPGGSFAQQGQLLLPRAALSAEGLYSCHDADGLLFSSISLRLGRPPGVPSISCRAPDFENFSCSWTSSVETLLPTCYIATYRKRSQTEDEKRRARNSNMGVCVQFPGWPYSCTVSKSEFWSVYRINVTEVNPLGSNFQLLDFTMQAIIKPDPPEGLRVEPVPTAPRRLRATWEYPVTWAKESYFLLKFRLRYRPVTHSSWSVVETANLSEVITDAVVSLEHVLQVGAKDFLDAGNWSEWSAEARATPTTGLTTTLREETSAIGQPESPAEEPSLAPNPQPIDRSDPTEKVAILVSLGIFAFIVLAAVLVVAILLW
uniref:Interleukin 11 receptor subunit alpha n=1 Tax=Sphenodon punctatus TaxID=8508 RepID=A0A8D0H1Z5_SPHPU